MPYIFRDNPNCPVCPAVGGERRWPVVAETEWSICVVPSRHPTPGTTLVVPRRHVHLQGELSDTEREDVWLLLRRTVGATLAAFDPLSYHVSQYVGALTGEPLEHLWWRVEPRHTKPQSINTEISGLPRTPIEEREKYAQALIIALALYDSGKAPTPRGG